MIFHAVHADCASLRSGDGTKLCGCLEHVTRDNKSLVLKQLWHVQTMVTLLQAGGGWKIPPPCPVSLLQLPLDIQTYHDIPKACHQARSTVVWDSVSMCLWIRKALPQANSPIARICFFQEWTTCWCEISDIKAYQTVALIHLARPAKPDEWAFPSQNGHHSDRSSLGSTAWRFQHLRLPKDGTGDPLLYALNNTFCRTISHGSMQLTHVCLCAHARTNKKIKFSRQDVVNLIKASCLPMRRHRKIWKIEARS